MSALGAFAFFATALVLHHYPLPAVYAFEVYHGLTMPPVNFLPLRPQSSQSLFMIFLRGLRVLCGESVIHKDDIFRYRDDIPAFGAKELANFGRVLASQRLQLCAAEIRYGLCLIV